jgi:hypothetical protein
MCAHASRLRISSSLRNYRPISRSLHAPHVRHRPRLRPTHGAGYSTSAVWPPPPHHRRRQPRGPPRAAASVTKAPAAHFPHFVAISCPNMSGMSPPKVCDVDEWDRCDAMDVPVGACPGQPGSSARFRRRIARHTGHWCPLGELCDVFLSRYVRNVHAISSPSRPRGTGEADGKAGSALTLGSRATRPRHGEPHPPCCHVRNAAPATVTPGVWSAPRCRRRRSSAAVPRAAAAGRPVRRAGRRGSSRPRSARPHPRRRARTR